MKHSDSDDWDGYREGRFVDDVPRVVLASRVYLPEPNAASFRLAALVDSLSEQQVAVDVVTSIPSRRFRESPVASDARISRWPVLRDRQGNVRGYVQYASFDAPLFFRLIWRRADVFISEPPPTTGLVVAAVSLLRRKPYVYYAADIMTSGAEAVGAPAAVVRVLRWIESTVVRRAHSVLAVSPEVANRVVALGADPDRVRNVGHGIDTSVFSPFGSEPQSAAPLYFVYTGTMSEVHTPQVLIRGFAQISEEFPELTLRFYGQGVLREEMERLADQLVAGRVEFHGLIPATQTARIIRGAVAAMVSLTPGIGYDFAHPTKAYAAVSCGVPVLFAGPDDFGRIVDAHDLGVAGPHDADAVATAMRRLLREHFEGVSAGKRSARAQWAERNVSLRDVGARAAREVIQAAQRTGGSIV